MPSPEIMDSTVRAWDSPRYKVVWEGTEGRKEIHLPASLLLAVSVKSAACNPKSSPSRYRTELVRRSCKCPRCRTERSTAVSSPSAFPASTLTTIVVPFCVFVSCHWPPGSDVAAVRDAAKSPAAFEGAAFAEASGMPKTAMAATTMTVVRVGRSLVITYRGEMTSRTPGLSPVPSAAPCSGLVTSSEHAGVCLRSRAGRELTRRSEPSNRPGLDPLFGDCGRRSSDMNPHGSGVLLLARVESSTASAPCATTSAQPGRDLG